MSLPSIHEEIAEYKYVQIVVMTICTCITSVSSYMVSPACLHHAKGVLEVLRTPNIYILILHKTYLYCYSSY